MKMKLIFRGKPRIPQYLASISCNMSTMMVAASFVWFTPILNDLLSPTSPIPMSLEESSWMIAIVEVGEIISPIPTGLLLNRWGRKLALLTTFPMIAISWIILLTTRSVGALYAVRILQGMAVGVVCTAAPVYVAEIAEPKIRGALCGQFQIMWLLGLLWSYSTGPFLNYDYYAYVTMILSFIFLSTFVFLPETPYFLIMKNREMEARNSLVFFRSSKYVDDELQTIKDSINAETEEGEWYDLFKTKKDCKMLLVVSSCCFVRYMSGSSALTEYLSTTVAYTGGHDNLNSNYVTILVSIVAIISSLVSSYVADFVGRRPLVFLSTIGAIAINLIAGIYYLLVDVKIYGIFNYSWIAYLCLCSYFILTNVGFCTVMQTLQAECFSSKNRGNAGAFISFLATIFIFISLKQYQSLIDCFGISLNFFSFAIYALVGSIAIFAFMRETAGKSLGEIQLSLRNESNE